MWVRSSGWSIRCRIIPSKHICMCFHYRAGYIYLLWFFFWGWWGPILLGDIKLEEGWWWKKTWIIRMLMNGWRHVLVSEQQQKIKQDYNYEAALAAPWGSNAHYTKENKTVGWKMEGQLYEKFVSYCADYNYRGSELENKRELLKSLYALVCWALTDINEVWLTIWTVSEVCLWGCPISNCRVWSFQSASWMGLCWTLCWNQ